MALVTVQRSPSVSSSPQSSDSGTEAYIQEDDAMRKCKSLSECYFAGKGAALVLPPNERVRPSRRVSAAGCDIQQHLQSMFYLLRPEETLKMAVKLESVHLGRTRYLVVVSCNGRQDAEESCLLGIDCHIRATVGLVLRVLADTAITLDGDGGFSVSVCGCQHIFKPVSVQAMWSALQTLHRVSGKARDQNYFLGGLSHDWVSYYEHRIESDRSCLNEWHAMDNLESRRPPSPDSVRSKPREREETERVIRATLKEIMMSVDLDEVTSKYIRGRLEEDLDMDLGEFKPFIDEEMLMILGQMDAPTEIFEHVYLGSEWNASNLEELRKNGVRHILNVTKEIDNFFPGMFSYLNIRVYDDEKTELLKHWDDTFKYITKAKKEGSKVLVHCKMGVSRSASVVIAYAMKAYNWDFSQAWKHVKNKRNCIKPNTNFLSQLETYQGILDAMKNKEKLQRSKSDTNLKSPITRPGSTKEFREELEDEKQPSRQYKTISEIPGIEFKKSSKRPKSWSSYHMENVNHAERICQSLESIDRSALVPEMSREDLKRGVNLKNRSVDQEARNVLIPCGNGQSYSVSQNQIVHLPGSDVPSVKCRINKLETQGHQGRKGLVLNLTNQFEAARSKPSSPELEADGDVKSFVTDYHVVEDEQAVNIRIKHQQQIDKKKDIIENDCVVCSSSEEDVKLVNKKNISVNSDLTTTETFNVDNKTKKRLIKDGDLFSTQLDKVFEREEKRDPARESPSRQSSWSSYDSAVVLDNSSVHSSWATLPSRNSSWGSYDIRTAEKDLLGSSGLFPCDKDDIPWHTGTVKRTKQKIEAGTVKRVCTQPNEEEKLRNKPRNSLEESLVNDEFHPDRVLQLSSSFTHGWLEPLSNDNLSKPQTSKQNFSSPIQTINISTVLVTQQRDVLSRSAPVSSVLSTDTENLHLRLGTCRSESSSPSEINTSQCSSVKHHKIILENLSKPNVIKCCLPVDDSPSEHLGSLLVSSSSSSSSSSSDGPRNISGIVKNLKKEFEAKSSELKKSFEITNTLNEQSEIQWSKREFKVIRSLPSSPVISHIQPKMHLCEEKNDSIIKSHNSTEDLSVKVLVGKYEVKPEKKTDVLFRTYRESDLVESQPSGKLKTAIQEFSRRSAPIIIDRPSFLSEENKAHGRPPLIPSQNVIIDSVIVKTANKKQQQHGRTHPLARLQVRPGHSSPVYNTM